jgi:hypothetical protein
LKNKMLLAIMNAIDRMETKQVALAKQPFSMQDLLTLFIDPAMHEPLTYAYRVCEPSGHTQDLFVFRPLGPEHNAGSAYVRFYWHGTIENGFYVPFDKGAQKRYPATIRDEAPAELVERFHQSAGDLVDIHYSFSLVRRALHGLNVPGVCPSIASLRYHWPCIVPLLNAARYSPMAEELIHHNVKEGDRARLSPTLRRLLGPSNQTVARHQLIDELEPPTQPPVAYELQHDFKQS